MDIPEFIRLAAINGIHPGQLCRPACESEKQIREMALSGARSFLRKSIYPDEIVVFPEREEESIVLRAGVNSFAVCGRVWVRNDAGEYDKHPFHCTSTLTDSGWEITDLKFPGKVAAC